MLPPAKIDIDAVDRYAPQVSRLRGKERRIGMVNREWGGEILLGYFARPSCSCCVSLRWVRVHLLASPQEKKEICGYRRLARRSYWIFEMVMRSALGMEVEVDCDETKRASRI